MRTTVKIIALALTVSTAALWAQTQTTPQPSPISDEGAVTSSTPAVMPTEAATPNPPTANPTNRESDAEPQSEAAQSSEPTPPVSDEPSTSTAAPPAESPQPAEPAPTPKTEVVSGTIVSTSASALVVDTMAGKLTFVVDSTTVEPTLHVKDAVSVEYVTLADGTRHANRVTLATPKKSAVAVAPRSTTPPPAATKPALEPEKPLASVAVAPPPPAPAPEATPAPPVTSEPAPAAEPLASGASSTDISDTHTLSGDAQSSASPLATTKVTRDYSPTRMIVPVVLLLGGLLFITVLGVRQARREA